MSFHPSLQVALRLGSNQANHNNNQTNVTINQLAAYGSLMTRPQPSSIAMPNRADLTQSSTLNIIGRTWRATKMQQLSQVFLKLKRSSVHDSWGIIFTRFDNRLILGDVKPRVQQCTEWSVVIAGSQQLINPLDAFTILQNPVERNASKVQVKAYAHAMSLPSWQVCDQLLPGDLLVSIDGTEPSAFGSMNGVTSYLRQALELSVVVLRHPNVTAASFACYNSHLLNQSPLGLAAAADHVWKSLLVVQPTDLKYSPPAVALATIPRQVTPDKSSIQSFSSQQASQSPIKGTKSAPVSAQYPRAKQLANPLKSATQISAPSYHGVRNPWFKENGVPIPYDDNWDLSPEDGTRAQLFLPPIKDFSSWLQNRKRAWRARYEVYLLPNERWDHGEEVDGEDDSFDRATSSVALDFWTPQGFGSFVSWLQKRKEGWRTNYKVYRNKRRRIHKECEEVVHLNENTSEEDFKHWLRIRKNQWKVNRRKRQRLRQIRAEEEGQAHNDEQTETDPVATGSGPAAGDIPSPSTPSTTVTHKQVHGGKGSEIKTTAKRRKLFAAQAGDMDMACIDDILEEEERRRRTLAERPPIDISFLFDSNKLAPDDVVVHIFGFLDRSEHGKLLCINKEYSDSLKKRDEVWRRLCPSHWKLPRRPRKAWHEIYITRLRLEQRDHQKRWDDLLLKCYATVCKGDQMNKIEKLVAKGEKDFGFHVNYVSPVVCERNCLLNLAVINRRHKIVRWLLDHKGAQIESYDRGQFTPLLNAAWSGDKPMVRLLLQRGADRSKVGFYHYSKGISSPDFKGLTAEGWARKKGFKGIAKLINLGL